MSAYAISHQLECARSVAVDVTRFGILKQGSVALIWGTMVCREINKGRRRSEREKRIYRGNRNGKTY